MNLKYLLAGVFVVAIVALASFGLAGTTGFFISGGENPGVQVNIHDGDKALTHDVTITPKESALDALVRVAVVDYKTQGEMGAFVTGINGVNQDDEHYWLYFVNDEMPSIACSHYHPNDGDVITFRYLTAGEAAEYF